MKDSRWERYGAPGGVVFVLLDVLVAVLGGEPPATDASRSEVISDSADNGLAIEAGLWFFGFASMALVWTSILGARTRALPCVWILGISYVMWSDLSVDAKVPAR